MNLQELKKMMDDNGRVKFDMKLSLSDLLYCDIAGINEIADERFFALGEQGEDAVHGSLSDIFYETKEIEKEESDHWAKGMIVIGVDASARDIVDDYEDD